MPPVLDYKKPVFLNASGLLQNLPNGSITNIGGTVSSSFLVSGKGLLFDDGSSTNPTNSAGLTLQKVYDRSADANGNAPIKLTTGKDLVIYDDTNNNLYFKIDAETGKVTITGDLVVIGESTLIDTVIQDSDHWRISPASSITTALKIEPEFTNTLVDLVNIKAISGGPLVFRIDKDGNTRLTNLFASGNLNVAGDIVINGLVDGVDISSLSLQVTSISNALATLSGNLSDHITPSITIKHRASEISVNPPPAFALGATNVQQVIDAIASAIGGGGGGGGGSGISDAGLFVTDVTPTTTGIVGVKQYVAGTIPANAVIARASTDTNNVRVHFIAEGNSLFYNPTVTVDVSPGPAIVGTMVEHPTDKRLFVGYADVVVSSTRIISLESSVGVDTSVEIVRADAGPSFNIISIGSLPGSQTAAKQGDTVTVVGQVQNAATYAEILNGVGAAGGTAPFVLTLGFSNSASAGYKTVTGSFIAGSGTGPLTISTRARNALGTYGPNMISNTVILDQVIPIIGPFTISYPVGQGAVKGSEVATVSSNVANQSSVLYLGTDLSITAPTVFATSKTATRTGGTYVESGTNYTITASKVANGSSATASTLVKIANTPPTAAITIGGNPARLISSPSGVTYTITLTASQTLVAAPTVTATSGTLSAFAGSGKVWTAALVIDDADPKGNQLFTILTMLNQALVNGTAVTSGASYVVGGFALRQIVYPPFARYAPFGTNVTNFSKVTAKYSGAGSNLTFYPDTGDHFQGFSIVNSLGVYDPMGTHLFISDAAFAGANTSGTLTLEIWEAA